MINSLAQIPRVDLGFLPTPLEPLDRLTEHLRGPRIWMKRDDCTGLATGGNKTRKLEFLMADAHAQGANTIVTFGAVQSNHARQTAAAAAKLGYECHLVLMRRVAWSHPEFETNGNVLLDRVLGARLHFCDPANADTMSRTLIDELTRQGKRCYVIPAGGSNAIGALGYARCAAELVTQCASNGFHPDLIVHATSSGGTQAGLVAGLVAEGVAWDVLGINVYDIDHPRIEQRVVKLFNETIARLGIRATKSSRIRIDHEFLGEDYGIPTRRTIEVIRLLAETEGILTDPVYSGKALSGLVDLVQGSIKGIENVIFVHTGGVASLPIYTSAFSTDRR
jgi:L-cysteate sulfo-lyase